MSLYGLLAEGIFVGGRRLIDRKYTEGLDQRHGVYGPSVPRGALWIHAVSVGEVQSALGLIEEVRRHASGLPLLLTTVTQTGAAMARQLMGEAVHAYYPWDAPSIVRRALSTLAPRCFVTMETELWPTMLGELARRGVPSFMVNGRLSNRSFAGYRRMRFFWKPVLRHYEVVMARTEEDSWRFLELGVAADRLVVTGEGKVDAMLARRRDTSPPSFDRPERPILLAGSTHQGEEHVVLDCWKHLRERRPQLRLVVAPRHPERAEAVAELFRDQGRVCRQSAMEPDWDVLVVDAIGHLFALYGAARAAFVGGSLVPKGGQNVYEPALWACPFCLGPSFEDFSEPVTALERLGLCHVVHDSTEMARYFEETLEKRGHEVLRANCEKFFAEQSGSAHRVWNVIDDRMTALYGQWR